MRGRSTTSTWCAAPTWRRWRPRDEKPRRRQLCRRRGPGRSVVLGAGASSTCLVVAFNAIEREALVDDLRAVQLHVDRSVFVQPADADPFVGGFLAEAVPQLDEGRGLVGAVLAFVGGRGGFRGRDGLLCYCGRDHS